MKIETVVKILNRYRKGLFKMEEDANINCEYTDAEHYRTDRVAMEQAIKIIERSNT